MKSTLSIVFEPIVGVSPGEQMVRSATLPWVPPLLGKADVFKVLNGLTIGPNRVTDQEGWLGVVDFICCHMPQLQREQFWHEFRAAVREVMMTGSGDALADVLAGWEATAEIEADPEEARALDDSIRRFEAGEFEAWEDVRNELLGE